MKNKVYSNIINEFSVRITYQHPNLKSSNIGSGVLVKISEDICYLITAKHNFKLDDDEKFWNVNVKILEENINNIHISNDNEGKVCNIDKLIYHDKKYDLLVFSLDNWSENIRKLPFMLIDKNLIFKEKKYCFYGYPDSIGTPSGILDYEGYLNPKDDEHIFRLEKNKQVKSDSLNGFSGSGIFIEDGDKYYLVGIFTAFQSSHDHYFGVNLILLLDEINKKLSSIGSINISSIENKNVLLENIHKNKEVNGVVVDITLLNGNKELYTVEVGMKYEDNSFLVKQTKENIYITSKNTDELKNILSELLKDLILDKESNFATETLIEFILPTTLLEIDFKELMIITKRRKQEKCLIDYFNYIIRSKDRIESHILEEDKDWINNWERYNMNKTNSISQFSKVIEKAKDIKMIRENDICIVQKISLKDSIDDIIEYGISIVMTPLKGNIVLNFPKFIQDTFGEKKLCMLYKECNYFMRGNYDSEEELTRNKSHILILWDDPTTIPNKEYRSKLIKGAE